MVFIVLKGLVRIFICIAIFTAVQAGIIGAYIPAFDTVTALPHSPVL